MPGNINDDTIGILQSKSRKEPTQQTDSPWYVNHGLSRMPTFSAPMALTIAPATSSTNRARFRTEPPYSSVLVFEFVCINWSGRYPFAAWISTPSNPAPRTAFSAAVAYSRTYSLISSTVSARGIGGGGDVDDVLSSAFVGSGIGLGATSGYPPFSCRIFGFAARPRATSWR